MNVQDLASLTDQILHITGLRVRETVPDWSSSKPMRSFWSTSPPAPCFTASKRGAIYAPERAKAESQRLFQEPTLVALRELAIRQTAQALEARATAKKEPTEARAEKILVNVTADPSTAMLLRRARRVADYLHAACVAVFICPEKNFPRCRPRSARPSSAISVSPKISISTPPSSQQQKNR
jgi:two-component system sensor histidine kinase KdpD